MLFSKPVGRALRVFAPILILAVSSCGYHLQGAGGSSLPPHIKKIYVPILTNKTLEQGLEVRVTDAIREMIINDGRVALSNGLSDADAILEGQVLQYRIRPIAFSRNDQAQAIRLRMSLSVILRDLESSKLLFRQTIVSDREYGVSSNLSGNEQAQTGASQQASKDMARELQGLMIEGF
jgi:outer membrane lipopolysaccharide assembly protein LptE/RlpB